MSSDQSCSNIKRMGKLFGLGAALLLIPSGAFSQFGGSTGRGDATVVFQPTPLASSIFNGSSGRGNVAVSYQPAPLPSSIFTGSQGRGDVAGSFQPAPLASSIFGGSHGRGDVATAFTPPSLTVAIAARGVLEGPYNSTTGLMGDALRIFQVIPFTEPYTSLGYPHVGGGGEIVASSELATTGSNAIVDWVVVELRGSLTPSTVLATRSALIQRDGDVVATDGISPLVFDLLGGDYHVALRHRNHLGVMTQTPVALSAVPTGVDFSLASTQIYGTDARKSIAGNFPAQALWAGDVTFNGQIKYTGSGNDRDPILVTVGSTTPNTVVGFTYSTRDVNMSAQVKYTGTNNDRDPILVNVGSTTPNNVRVQQLP